MRKPYGEKFTNKIAIITGGASGIGRAIGEELARHGGIVTLADINGSPAADAAKAIQVSGGKAQAAALYVTDAVAVQKLVHETVTEHGRVEYMFNNAGITMFGEVRDITLDDWDRILDVNLRGVIHGVMAAYPIMVRQGSGHIVNTGSLYGLTPSPGGIPYATSKYGVVGLSTSLRAEAAALGVKVSVVCPGFIDTPIKDSAKYINISKEEALSQFPLKLASVEKCAQTVLHGVARNKDVIIVTPFAWASWLLYRLSPGFVSWLSQKATDRFRSLRNVPPA